jgi:hypothetical protein
MEAGRNAARRAAGKRQFPNNLSFDQVDEQKTSERKTRAGSLAHFHAAAGVADQLVQSEAADWRDMRASGNADPRAGSLQ